MPSYYDNLDLLRELRTTYPSLIGARNPYSEYEDSVKSDTPTPVALYTGVFAAISVSFMFLLKFLSDSTDYVNVIEYICGARKDTVVFVKLATDFIMTLGSGAAGVLLHIILYKPLFSKLNVYENAVYTAAADRVITIADVIITGDARQNAEAAK